MKRKMIEKSAENGPRMATVNNPIGPKPLSARSNYDLVHASLNDFESSFLKQWGVGACLSHNSGGHIRLALRTSTNLLVVSSGSGWYG